MYRIPQSINYLFRITFKESLEGTEDDKIMKRVVVYNPNSLSVSNIEYPAPES